MAMYESFNPLETGKCSAPKGRSMFRWFLTWVSIPWKQGSALRPWGFPVRLGARLMFQSLGNREVLCAGEVSIDGIGKVPSFNPLETGKCSAPVHSLPRGTRFAFQSLGNREVLCAMCTSSESRTGPRVSIPWKQGSALRRRLGADQRDQPQSFNPLETGKCSAPLPMTRIWQPKRPVSIPWKQGSALRQIPPHPPLNAGYGFNPLETGKCSAPHTSESEALRFGRFNPLETGKCSAPLSEDLAMTRQNRFQSLGNREVLCAPERRDPGHVVRPLFQSLGNREVLCAGDLRPHPRSLGRFQSLGNREVLCAQPR